jgi:hypothetical protein
MTNILRIPANSQGYLTAIRDAAADKFDVIDFTFNYGVTMTPFDVLDYYFSDAFSQNPGSGGIWYRFSYRLTGESEWTLLSFTPLHWDGSVPDGPITFELSQTDLDTLNAAAPPNGLSLALEICMPEFSEEYSIAGMSALAGSNQILTRAYAIVSYHAKEDLRREVSGEMHLAGNTF